MYIQQYYFRCSAHLEAGQVQALCRVHSIYLFQRFLNLDFSWHGLIDAIPVKWKKELKAKIIPRYTPPFDSLEYVLVFNSA